LLKLLWLFFSFMPQINFFAKTDFRNEEKVFGIKKEDRRLHMYIIGKTGMGKTTLLLNMILNDIYGNEGVCFIDPHGDAVEKLLDYIPSHRINDVIYFNPADVDYPIALNILGDCSIEDIHSAGQRHLLVSSLISIFRKLYAEYWQHRQEHILRNTILALLDEEKTLFDYDKNKTLLDIYRMLSDWRYRNKIVERVRDPIVKSFWKNEFPKYLYQFKGEALAPIQNKLGAFLSVPLVRNIVAQAENKVDFRWLMDKQKILLVNLAKGRIGEDNSSFLGSLLITKLQLAAISRIDIVEEQRNDFYLFVDEFQNFVATETFDGILSEARKYRLCLALSHQYIGQLDERLSKAIFGNVGTIITFPIGAENGESLEKEFYPEFNLGDMINHGKHHIYLKLAIDGKTSQAFSAITLPPFYGFQTQGNREKIIMLSRARYAGKREEIEKEIEKQAG
jgi:type IV secretory pathway TraG/TraD family ATPase VirD4